MILRQLYLTALLAALLAPDAGAQTSIRSDIIVTRVGTVFPDAVQLERIRDEMYYMRLNGNVYRLVYDGAEYTSDLLYTTDDHGLKSPQGMAIDRDNTLYLVGNQADGLYTTATIKRGVLVEPNSDSHARTWSTLAVTEPYPLTGGGFNHLFNGIVADPAGGFIYVNSGARGDHGEIHDADGNFPGLRDTPLTSIILRLPTDSTNLLLRNDSTALAPYVFARGIRNTFSLAFKSNGDLFGVENSGDRNDPEEINWIGEGQHYGFPWRMGTNDTPQQFSGYDPETDPLINTASFAYTSGLFYDDPTYPAPPAGVTFTDPIPNLGPDADKFADLITGSIRDASDEDTTIASFTAHRSPLGLVFNLADLFVVDAGEVITDEFRGGGFMLSWTDPATELLGPMQDDGEDLLHLNLEKVGDTYSMHTTQLVTGFDNPIDAVFDILETRLFILENGASRGLWEVKFPTISVGVDDEVPESPIALSIYPNPMSDEGTIDFHLPAGGPVRITLYDLLGREQQVLVDDIRNGGSHQASLSRGGLPAGVYFVRLEAGGDQRVLAIALR